MKPFNLEAVYDAEIAPLMDQIIAICKREQLPMLATFAFAHNDEETLFCTTSIPRGNEQPDEIKEAFNIIRHGASTRGRLTAITITSKGK